MTKDTSRIELLAAFPAGTAEFPRPRSEPTQGTAKHRSALIARRYPSEIISVGWHTLRSAQSHESDVRRVSTSSFGRRIGVGGPAVRSSSGPISVYLR